MSLIDEARAEMQHVGSKCGVRAIIDAHPDDTDDITEAMDESALTGAALARALVNRYGDEAPSEGTVVRHRKGRCSCG